MTDEMAGRTVVSLATVREVAAARLAALSHEWDMATGDPLRTARLEVAVGEVSRLCSNLGAGVPVREEDGSVGWRRPGGGDE